MRLSPILLSIAALAGFSGSTSDVRLLSPERSDSSGKLNLFGAGRPTCKTRHTKKGRGHKAPMSHKGRPWTVKRWSPRVPSVSTGGTSRKWSPRQTRDGFIWTADGIAWRADSKPWKGKSERREYVRDRRQMRAMV